MQIRRRAVQTRCLREHEVVEVDRLASAAQRSPSSARVEEQQVLHETLEAQVFLEHDLGELRGPDPIRMGDARLSACSRIVATGERSSCDASETNRRWRA